MPTSEPTIGLLALVWGCVDATYVLIVVMRRRRMSPPASTRWLSAPWALVPVIGVGVVAMLIAFGLLSLSAQVTHSLICGSILPMVCQPALLVLLLKIEHAR